MKMLFMPDTRSRDVIIVASHLTGVPGFVVSQTGLTIDCTPTIPGEAICRIMVSIGRKPVPRKKKFNAVKHIKSLSRNLFRTAPGRPIQSKKSKLIEKMAERESQEPFDRPEFEDSWSDRHR